MSAAMSAALRRTASVLLVGALLAGGCGDPAIPRGVARDLQADVASIRVVVEEGRVFAARARLTRLTADVTQLLDRGVIDEGAAMEILDAAAAVRAALTLAPTSSATTTETTSPSPEDGGEEGGHGGNAYGQDKDKGKGKGKGHGNDD
jgi:hypothetical protein